MTPKQIKSVLVKANINIEGLVFENHDEIELSLGYEESNGFGSCNSELIDAKHIEIMSVLPEFKGGFYTGYGALILQKGYTVSNDDYNDVCSADHY